MSKAALGPITVHSFAPAWGIPVPTCSPFGLKLITWLKMYGVPHTMVVANDPRKGPKGKCPWVEFDGVTMGDSELILERLKTRVDRDLDSNLTAEQKAVALSVRRMLDEHYHQAWEHQLFIDDAGWQRGQEFFNAALPPGVRVIVRNLIRRDLRKQLHARGVGRHSGEDIIRMGIADLDAVSALLGDRPYFFGDEPTDIDATVFAFLVLTQHTPSPSPLWAHFRALKNLPAYCDRMLGRYFA